MHRKLCLVTGATNGIGEVTATALAQMGATVVIIGRNEDKAKATIQKIKSTVTNADVSYLLADLSRMAQVKRVADEFRAKYDRLDVLVNNAGARFDKHTPTSEGLEMTFALNHMSYFYLTHLLLDMLKATGTATQKARVVNVSSSAHRIGKLNFDDLQSEQKYSAFRVYGQSKMMNIMFTNELSRRLVTQGANITVNSLHPGAVRTGFGANDEGFFKFVIALLRPFFLAPEQGAQTSIYLASSSEVEGVTGQYFARSKIQQPSKDALTESDWTQLWAYSENMLRKLEMGI